MARDGTVAAMLVADGGRIVEFVQVGRVDPPTRPSRRWIAPDLRTLRERAEARRLAALTDAFAAARLGRPDRGA